MLVIPSDFMAVQSTPPKNLLILAQITLARANKNAGAKDLQTNLPAPYPYPGRARDSPCSQVFRIVIAELPGAPRQCAMPTLAP